MANVIYLKDENGKLTTLKETAYNSEDVFQKLLEDYPALLTGEGEEENSKWVLLSREMGVPEYDGGSSQWFLDHLFSLCGRGGFISSSRNRFRTCGYCGRRRRRSWSF